MVLVLRAVGLVLPVGKASRDAKIAAMTKIPLDKALSHYFGSPFLILGSSCIFDFFVRVMTSRMQMAIPKWGIGERERVCFDLK